MNGPASEAIVRAWESLDIPADADSTEVTVESSTTGFWQDLAITADASVIDAFVRALASDTTVRKVTVNGKVAFEQVNING